MAGRFLFGAPAIIMSRSLSGRAGMFFFYGGDIVKKNAGEFTKYIAAIIAERWIRKTDAKRNATNQGKQTNDKRGRNDYRR